MLTVSTSLHYQEIHKDFVITCPLCRKVFPHQEDVTSLPNNPYALHMLTLAEKGPAVAAIKQDSTRYISTLHSRFLVINLKLFCI